MEGERSISQGHKPSRGGHDDDNKSEMYGTKSAWTDASAMFVTEHERQKLRVVRKLITICSIDDKEVKKGFTRLLGLFTSTKRREDKIRAAKSELEEKTKNVLSDPAKFDDFKKLTEDLLNPNENFLDTFIKMIKVFIISPIELGYITKLEDELAENEKYEAEIQSLSEKVKKDKETRLKTAPTKDNCEAMMREIAVFENKLEKANQRLNETIAYNAQLREKINELRKEKLLLEDVEKKLKSELEEKREKVEKTIQVAGQAYLKRNEAEKELESLQEKAKKQREEFEAKIQDRNKSIEDDRKFKNFLKTKQKEKAELEALEKAIAKNLQIIKEKEEANAQIEQEYMQSTKREEEIRQAFDRIKKETGITHCEELLERFTQLNEKNATMTKFVEELTKELEDLEKKIADVKKEIQYYNTKGATNDNTKREKKIELSQKILQEEKKKQLYKSQYEKSLETINFIKEHLEKVFEAIEVDPSMIENLKNSAVTEENMMYYLGILEQKGIEIISEYSRLIAEQLKMEKGDSVPQNQIDDLNNIIAYENATMMNYYSNVDKDAARNKNDFPEDILPAENNIDNDKWMSEEELRKSALQFLTKKVNMDTAGNGTMGAKTSSLAPKDKRKKTVVVKK